MLLETKSAWSLGHCPPSHHWKPQSISVHCMSVSTWVSRPAQRYTGIELQVNGEMGLGRQKIGMAMRKIHAPFSLALPIFSSLEAAISKCALYVPLYLAFVCWKQRYTGMDHGLQQAKEEEQ